MVAETVEQRGGQLLVAGDLDPFGQREVGRDDRGAAFVAVGEQVEEQLAAGALERHEAEFVDDQQGDTQLVLMQAGQREFNARLDQFAHEVGSADEGDPLAALDGFDPERDREVGLAGPDRTGDHDIIAALDVVAGGQLGPFRFDPCCHGQPPACSTTGSRSQPSITARSRSCSV